MVFFYNGNERICGWESYPTHFGAFLAIVGALFVSIILVLPQKKNFLKQSKLDWVIFIFLSVVLYYIQWLLCRTYSRGATLGIFSTVPLIIGLKYIVYRKTKVWNLDIFKCIILIVLLVAVVFQLPDVANRTVSMADVNDGSIANRLLYWKYGGAMLNDVWAGGYSESELSILFNCIYSPPSSVISWEPGKYMVSNLVNTPLSLFYKYGMLIGSISMGGYFMLQYENFKRYQQGSSVSAILLISSVVGFIVLSFLWIGESFVLIGLMMSLGLSSLAWVYLSTKERRFGLLRRQLKIWIFCSIFTFVTVWFSSFLLSKSCDYKRKQLHIEVVKDQGESQLLHRSIWYSLSDNVSSSVNRKRKTIILTDDSRPMHLRKCVESLVADSEVIAAVLMDKSRSSFEQYMNILHEHLDSFEEVEMVVYGIYGSELMNRILLEQLDFKISKLTIYDGDMSLGIKESPFEILQKIKKNKGKRKFPEVVFVNRPHQSRFQRLINEKFFELFN